MVQQTTSKRKITMQISNLFIPEIILQKHVGISWCANMATCETNCFLFYKDVDECGDFKREGNQVSLSECNADISAHLRRCHLSTATWNLFVLYNNEKPFFISKYFNITRTPAFLTRLCPLCTKKKAIWRDLRSIQNEAISLVAMHSKKLWLVEKNCATVKPDSSVAPRWMKTDGESRIELRNLQNLKKMLENQVSFCHRSSPVSRKAWTLPWKLQELKKYPRKTCGYFQPTGFEWKERGDFWLLWLVILKSACYSVGDTF